MRALLSHLNKFLILALLLLVGCERPDPAVTVVGENAPVTPFVVQGVQPATAVPQGQVVPTAVLPTRAVYAGQPTPDPPRSSGDAGSMWGRKFWFRVARRWLGRRSKLSPTASWCMALQRVALTCAALRQPMAAI